MIYTTSINYPNIFSTISGSTVLKTTYEGINNRLSLLLQSAYLELFGDPDFGCGLYETTFDYAEDATFDNLKNMIVDSISRYETSITVSSDDIDIKFNKEDNHIKIKISYKINNTNIRNTANLELEVGANE